MTPFTDADLRRLEEALSRESEIDISYDEICAIIARLANAEALCRRAIPYHPGWAESRAWRKAAGKDK